MFKKIWQNFTRRGRTIDEIVAALDGQGVDWRAAGFAVTMETAMQASAVLGCMRAIGLSCASPPLHVMREMDGEKFEKARDDKVYRLLHRRPNEWQTSYDFRLTMTIHAVVAREGLAWVTKDSDGNILELIPIEPKYRNQRRVPGRRDKVWDIYDDNGFVGTFPEDRFLKLPNMMWSHCKGLDGLHLARNAIGLSMAAELSQSRLYRQGAKTQGILSTEQEIDADQVERIRDQFAKNTTGEGEWKTPILDRGLTFQNMTMSGVDAEQLDTRKFQIEEVCRALGVFPQMAMSNDKTANFASVEAFFGAHHRFTAIPWQENWAQRLDEFVLDGEGPLFVVFDNTQLTMGNMKDRAAFYNVVIAQKIYGRNELRAKFEGMVPLDELDALDELERAERVGGADNLPDDEREPGNEGAIT